MSEATQCDVGAEVMVKPVVVDVYAYLADGDVLFTHAWKRDGDPVRKQGRIEIPHKETDVPIHFHLHDKTSPNLHLAFISTAEDAMWVDTKDCPSGRGNGGQICYDSSAPNQLKITDDNKGPACILHYALRFSGDPVDPKAGRPGSATYDYDPEIKNGGTQ